jgi:hypothetical protein
VQWKLQGKPAIFDRNPVIFPFCQQSFHMDKPGMEARPPFAMKLRRLSDIFLEIHLFYTIKHIWYFTFFNMGFWQYTEMSFSSTRRQHINIQDCQHSSATAMVLVYTSWSKLQISVSAGYWRLCLQFVIHHQITNFCQTNLLFIITTAEIVKSLVMMLQITFHDVTDNILWCYR